MPCCPIGWRYSAMKGKGNGQRDLFPWLAFHVRLLAFYIGVAMSAVAEMTAKGGHVMTSPLCCWYSNPSEHSCLLINTAKDSPLEYSHSVFLDMINRRSFAHTKTKKKNVKK
jgi:hypothetical protein